MQDFGRGVRCSWGGEEVVVHSTSSFVDHSPTLQGSNTLQSQSTDGHKAFLWSQL
jgi:hypothetical protein